MGQILKYPTNLDPNKIGGWVKFSAGKGGNLGSVCLPTPQGLRFSTSLEYNAVSLGIITPFVDTFNDQIAAAQEDGKTSPGEILSAAGSSLKDAFNGTINNSHGAAKNNIALQAALATQLLNTTGLNPIPGLTKPIETFSGKILHDEKIAINPNTEIYFRNASIRTFPFYFTLVAKSEAESFVIRDIVRFFEYGALPSFSNGSRYVLKNPDEFQIRFYFKGEINEFIPKIKTCAITNIDHNYNKDGNVWNRNGSPLSVTVKVTFTELKINTKENIYEDDDE